MSDCLYRERISAEKLRKMRASDLRKKIRELEDELNRMFIIKEVSIRAMSEYAKSLENRIENSIEAIEIHEMYDSWRYK
jgi:hypothetical protein